MYFIIEVHNHEGNCIVSIPDANIVNSVFLRPVYIMFLYHGICLLFLALECTN